MLLFVPRASIGMEETDPVNRGAEVLQRDARTVHRIAQRLLQRRDTGATPLQRASGPLENVDLTPRVAQHARRGQATERAADDRDHRRTVHGRFSLMSGTA